MTKSEKCGIMEKSAPEPPGSRRQNLRDTAAANLSLKNEKQKSEHMSAIIGLHQLVGRLVCLLSPDFLTSLQFYGLFVSFV